MRLRLVLAALVASGAVVVLAAPALAAPYQPDGRIRADGVTPFLGNNVYNNTAFMQTALAESDPGTKVRYTIRAQNDGNKADRLIVNSNQASNNFQYKFKSGGANITSQVVAPGTGYKTPRLLHNEYVTISLVVTIESDVQLVQQDLANIEIDSKNDNKSEIDLVRGETEVTD